MQAAVVELELQRALASNLRDHRKALGLTQERFAEHIGQTRAWVGRVEQGKRNLTLRTIERVARQLGVPPYTLFLPPGATVQLPQTGNGSTGPDAQVERDEPAEA